MEELQCGDESRLHGPSMLFNNCRFSLGHANPLLTFIFIVAFSDIRSQEALSMLQMQQVEQLQKEVQQQQQQQQQEQAPAEEPKEEAPSAQTEASA
jgi:hypothetical protein